VDRSPSDALRCRVGAIAVVALTSLAPVCAQALVELRHAHGIGYSADGSQILVPNHFGIAVYSAGRWSRAPGPPNDFMGFVATRDFLFSSGHLAGSRGADNPLGLVRSGDGGRSWTKLGFEGAAEFHLVAAGYFTNAVYVYNAMPNALMPRTGIYRMVGERLAGWREAAGRGLEGELAMLTAHPREAATLAAATDAGVFVSRDGGEEFSPVIKAVRATTARFMLDGEALLVGTLRGRLPGLVRIALKDGSRRELALPSFGRDAVANVVQNPVRLEELALISYERAVFISADGGRSWRRIARPRGTLPGS
jgi:hypothetical protein